MEVRFHGHCSFEEIVIGLCVLDANISNAEVPELHLSQRSKTHWAVAQVELQKSQVRPKTFQRALLS